MPQPYVLTWERTSSRGTRYFSGFLGDANIVMFEAGPHPDREGVTIWRLFAQERDPTRRPAAQQPHQPPPPAPRTPLAERHDLARRVRDMGASGRDGRLGDDGAPFDDTRELEEIGR